MYVSCIEIYIYCICSMYILYRSLSPLVVYIGWGSQSPNWKYTVLNWNFVFDFCDFDLHSVFQEHNPGVKWELLVCKNFIGFIIILNARFLIYFWCYNIHAVIVMHKFLRYIIKVCEVDFLNVVDRVVRKVTFIGMTIRIFDHIPFYLLTPDDDP